MEDRLEMRGIRESVIPCARGYIAQHLILARTWFDGQRPHSLHLTQSLPHPIFVECLGRSPGDRVFILAIRLPKFL